MICWVGFFSNYFLFYFNLFFPHICTEISVNCTLIWIICPSIKAPPVQGWWGHSPGLYLLLWQFPVLGLLHLAEESLHASIFFVLFCVFCCCGACFGLIFLKRVPRNLYVRSRGKPTLILLFDFLFATCGETSHKPEVYPLLHGSSPGWGARRARNRPGCWPGKEQDVFLQKYSVGESVIWKNDLYRGTVEWWWGPVRGIRIAV